MQANSPVHDNDKLSSRSNSDNHHENAKRLEAGIRNDDHSQTDPNEGDKEMVIVDWDGPDDPGNPKKCVGHVVDSTSFMYWITSAGP